MSLDRKKSKIEVFRRVKKIYNTYSRKYTTKDRVVFETEDGIEISVPKRLLKSIAVGIDDGIMVSLERAI